MRGDTATAHRKHFHFWEDGAQGGDDVAQQHSTVALHGAQRAALHRAQRAALHVWIAVVLSMAAAPTAAEPVSFSKDIAPLLVERCGMCHHPGGPAPFSLLTYADAKRHEYLSALGYIPKTGGGHSIV